MIVMVGMLWFALFGVSGIAVYMARTPIRNFVRFIWEDGTRLFCCCLVVLAAVATGLNVYGIHPMSIPGMVFMGLLFVLVGALFLYWGEVKRL